MSDHSTWLASGSYKKQEVAARLVSSPFAYDSADKICVLQCRPDFWANKSSAWDAAADVFDQRCTSTNCKSWDYASNLDAHTSEVCTACWDTADMSTYASWDGRTSYTEQEVAGRLSPVPFYHDPTTKQCNLQCSTGYWSNSGSAYNTAADVWDQRCTWDNCKHWDYNSSVDAKSCSACWSNSDISTYSGWDARGSYRESEVSGRDLSLPFLHDDNMCILQCAAGYWANWGTAADLISATDPELDQRCTSDNCKTFDAA
jgi:hypothetical protein